MTQDDIAQVLARSEADWPGERLSAIEAMRSYISKDLAVFNRVCALLDDGVVTVQVQAADTLVEEGGLRGLAAVLGYIGAHEDDPDTDYITYRLEELEGLEKVKVLAGARALAAGDVSADVRRGVAGVESHFGRLAPRKASE